MFLLICRIQLTFTQVMILFAAETGLLWPGTSGFIVGVFV